MTTPIIHFEHPLSERVRNFLRIETLFKRFHETLVSCEIWAHHSALFTLFEIMEAAARAELKLDILQELERQKIFLQRYPDDNLFQGAVQIGHIQEAAANLQGVQQKFGQHLRENEWLMAIRQRMFVPGGTGPFDLPSYYFWQNLPCAEREEQLRGWIGSLLPTQEAICLLLYILRQNVQTEMCLAEKGNYRHNSLGQNIHMLGIDVEAGREALPEVSANKYFTHIRFLEFSNRLPRGEEVADDVPFTLFPYSFDPVPAS